MYYEYIHICYVISTYIHSVIYADGKYTHRGTKYLQIRIALFLKEILQAFCS